MHFAVKWVNQISIQMQSMSVLKCDIDILLDIKDAKGLKFKFRSDRTVRSNNLKPSSDSRI